jgi:hypothetical protein
VPEAMVKCVDYTEKRRDSLCAIRKTAAKIGDMGVPVNKT